MLHIDEDDPPLKTSIVRPNDILDIEFSPIVKCMLRPASDGISQRLPLKPYRAPKTSREEKRFVKNQNITAVTLKNYKNFAMKRGDPFLPSVFSDENPFADLTMKKSSRKKPSDCKCKGFGYNLSPSALLPEEMRQQWGVGMFGKVTTLQKPLATSATRQFSTPLNFAPSLKEGQTAVQPSILQGVGRINTEACASSFCVHRCKVCLKEPCQCQELTFIQDGFRIPEWGDKKKIKTPSLRIKDTHSSGFITPSLSTSAPVLKRNVRLSNKENSNIISTSNFGRHSVSHAQTHRNSFPPKTVDVYCDRDYYAVPRSKSASNLFSSLSGPHFTHRAYANRMYHNENLSSLPRLQATLKPRRVRTNISPSPIISTGALGPSSFNMHSKKIKPKSVPPMRRYISARRDCSCDTCRRRSNIMSSMEASSMSTSEGNSALFSMITARPQRYQPMKMSTLTTAKRFSPYTLSSYAYNSPSFDDGHISPDKHTRSSSPFFEYNFSGFEEENSFPNPSPLSQTMNRATEMSAYTNIDSSLQSLLKASSPNLGAVGDITEMSIKDTVNFFVSMKPPISKSPISETSSSSPVSPMGVPSGSPLGSAGDMTSFFWSSSGRNNYDSILTSDRNHRNLQPSSLDFTGDLNENDFRSRRQHLYSSMVSDLEDELRNAIENIPT